MKREPAGRPHGSRIPLVWTMSQKGRLERPWRWLQSERAALVGLVLAAVLLEFGLVRGWLRAFSLFGRPGFPAAGQDGLIWLLGDGQTGINRFLVLLVVA